MPQDMSVARRSGINIQLKEVPSVSNIKYMHVLRMAEFLIRYIGCAPSRSGSAANTDGIGEIDQDGAGNHTETKGK